MSPEPARPPAHDVVVVPYPELVAPLTARGARVRVHDGSTPPDLTGASFVVLPHGGEEAVLAALADHPEVRVLQLLTAGTEGVAGRVPPAVRVVSASALHAGPVAELAVALTLASLNRIPELARSRRWQDRAPRTGLAGRTVVVLGAGAIGTRVGDALRALGAEPVLLARRARPGVLGTEALPDLLPRADVLVVAVPSSSSTRGLVGRAALARLPDGALVVNVGRGDVVDTGALTDEVTAGRLRAALDVVEPEPLPGGHPLWEAPGALVVPHLGAKTTDLRERAAAFLEEQVADHLAGRPLRGAVTG